MANTGEGLTTEVIRELLIEAVRRDEWLTTDDLYDLARRFGEQVYCLYWDSGGPGAGAGTELVYRFGDRYLTASASFGWGGPHDSLDEANGTIFVTGATKEITCSEWDEDEILARIELHGEPDVVTINGTEWPYEHLEHRVGRPG